MEKNHLISEGAISEIRKLAEDIKTALMATNLNAIPSHLIPMTTKKVDYDGGIWFLSNKNSEHNAHLQLDKNIQLIYSNPSSLEFLTIFGEAYITTDRAILESLYSSLDESWFNGVDDPNLTAIKVSPKTVDLWDRQHRKFVNLNAMTSRK